MEIKNPLFVSVDYFNYCYLILVNTFFLYEEGWL